MPQGRPRGQAPHSSTGVAAGGPHPRRHPHWPQVAGGEGRVQVEVQRVTEQKGETKRQKQPVVPQNLTWVQTAEIGNETQMIKKENNQATCKTRRERDENSHKL